MTTNYKSFKTALISTFNKEGLSEIIELLASHGVSFISTGGTRSFIEGLGHECQAVENLTDFPSIFGGRVKTLHPRIFGGILNRRDFEEDSAQCLEFNIPQIDLVIVDLYPFEDTVASGADKEAIIEKIDIGGVSLIRAAAKNFKDVVIVASKNQYAPLIDLLKAQGAKTTLTQRQWFAREAFAVTSGYDTAIFDYFNQNSEDQDALRIAVNGATSLRYGENPHQKGTFYGNFKEMFDQLHGKEISFNNLLDIDAATSLIKEFEEPTFAVIKHNNACGLASRDNITEAWEAALQGDPVSAFGGVLVANREINNACAESINKIFFEIIIAPSYTDEALTVLCQKKNRIVLLQKRENITERNFRSVLNGVLVQTADTKTENESDLKTVTVKEPSKAQTEDLLFANKIVKHSKSNAIVLAKNKQLIGSGVGQTSRVDALKQAIAKAQAFDFELKGAVMASDAFFPFADCVSIAHEAGIDAVIQPGGSIRDNESVVYCDENQMTMIMTGFRHFKH